MELHEHVMDVISSTDVISTIKTLLNPWLKIQIDQDKFDKLIQSFQAIILKQIGQDSEKKYWGIGGGLLDKVSVFASDKVQITCVICKAH